MMTTLEEPFHLPDASPQASREVRRNSPIRQARTCYDHLAGVAGVALMDALLQRRWLEVHEEAKGKPQLRLTLAGYHALSRRGVHLLPGKDSNRMYVYGCVDWTERRFHLGGFLGANVLHALLKAGVISRQEGSRVVTLLKPLDSWLDIDPD